MNTTQSQNRHLTAIPDLSAKEVAEILQDAFAYKQEYDQGKAHEKILANKTVSLVFEKPSLRTRFAFEAAVAALGGTPIFQSGVEIFTRADGLMREKISDIALVLERYCNCVIARVNDHDAIAQMADCVSAPVINALCDQHHPTQAIADLMAIQWHKPDLQNAKVAYIGDGNNVATSLMHICTMMGVHFVHGGPELYQIPQEHWQIGQAYAKQNGTGLNFTKDAAEAAADADVIYTDTFVSMGDEHEMDLRLKEFAPYQVTGDLMALAKPDAIFLHCLPAHRGEEVRTEVIDGPQSKVFDLAECRMHVAKALLKFFLT